MGIFSLHHDVSSVTLCLQVRNGFRKVLTRVKLRNFRKGDAILSRTLQIDGTIHINFHLAGIVVVLHGLEFVVQVLVHVLEARLHASGTQINGLVIATEVRESGRLWSVVWGDGARLGTHFNNRCASPRHIRLLSWNNS